MKQFVCTVCVLCGVVISSFAQSPSLQVATDKTISLVFPYSILHVDRGTKDVLVQPVREAGNILLVKAACKNFPGTNLSVVTGDGSVYSIGISYGEPSTWIYHFPVGLKTSISTYASRVLDHPKTVKGVRDAHWDMIGSVIGIYSKDEVMYYQLLFQNRSPIDYDVNFLRFYIRDKQKAKRTAVQQTEITPLYLAGDISKVRAMTSNSIVVAVNRFTIPDGKYLAIEMGEKNGGRNLLIRVNNRKILRAIPLPDQK